MSKSFRLVDFNIYNESVTCDSSESSSDDETNKKPLK